MKGLLLAGGLGTRLFPLTFRTSKQLLPIYNKPMVYYPLSTLMLSGIRNIRVVCASKYQGEFAKLLKDGHQWGIQIDYSKQEKPNGLAREIIVNEEFIDGEPIFIILGDNVIYGEGLIEKLQQATKITDGAQIFAYEVVNPKQYGIVEVDESNDIQSIEEKPRFPKSNYAVPGLYFYDGRVVEIAKSLRPKAKGGHGITNINRKYLREHKLKVTKLGKEITWMDAGTHETLFQSSALIRKHEREKGSMIACIEEVAFRMGYIDRNQLMDLLPDMDFGKYREYLSKLGE